MQSIKFQSFEAAKAASDRVFHQASIEGLFVSGTSAYAIPHKNEFWTIPVLQGFERFFTQEELEVSDIIENGYHQIKPSQGKIQLHRMGILDSISQMIDASEDTELKIFWEYALVWEIDNQYVIQLAQSLGMTTEQIRDFFFEASQIR